MGTMATISKLAGMPHRLLTSSWPTSAPLALPGYVRATRQAIEESEEITLVVTPERVLRQDFSPETPWFGKVWLVLKRVLPPWL